MAEVTLADSSRASLGKGDDIEDRPEDADAHRTAGGAEELHAAGDDAAPLPTDGVLRRQEEAIDAGPKPSPVTARTAARTCLDDAVGGAHEQPGETDDDRGRAEERRIAESPADDQRRGGDPGQRPGEHDRRDHPRRRARPTAANTLHIQRHERVQAEKADAQ